MRKTLHAAELAETRSACRWARPDVAAARAGWREKQPSLIPGRLFFLDEASVRTNMVRDYGWAPRGERLVASVPHGYRKTSTFIGCLREGGMEPSSAFSEVAPYVLAGAVNGELFVASIEQQVVPSLARGDVLIMDNLPVHKAAGVRKALAAAGIALLFLPAHSPDLREMAFGHFRENPDRDGVREDKGAAAQSRHSDG